MTPQRLTFAVLGPGGIGGLLAALLTRAGDAVEVLASDTTGRAIASGGISVQSHRFGNFTEAVGVARRLKEPVDAVLITVKATQLKAAVDRVPASALGEGLVIPFLNGLDHVGVLRGIYPPSSVVPATIRIETTKLEPGLIRHTSPFARVEMAVTPRTRDRVESIASHLRAAGLDVSTMDDEKAMLWDKYAMLGPLALLTTHARANVGAIRTERRQELVAVLDEIASIAKAEGVPVDASAVLRAIDSVPEAMETSMQRDQAAGRALELDALGSAMLTRATAAGLDAPVTRRLVEEIRARSVATPRD